VGKYFVFGIGKFFSADKGFLEQGARVTAHYNTKITLLESLLSESGPHRIQALQADLTEESAVKALFKNAIASFGHVHVLILNHAIYEGTDQPVFKMPLEQWNRTINTNLTSTFIVAKEYLGLLEGAPTIVKDYASIVMIGSTAGKYGSSYAGSGTTLKNIAT
jgi:NAD(P)-dependent dehydrogenase (short-subunit alcohol dehydrogenase family)